MVTRRTVTVWVTSNGFEHKSYREAVGHDAHSHVTNLFNNGWANVEADKVDAAIAALVAYRTVIIRGFEPA